MGRQAAGNRAAPGRKAYPMTERLEEGCLLPDGCPDPTKCRHRCLEAVTHPLPSSDGSFTKTMLANVPPEVFKPQQIDFKSWIELCNITVTRQVGWSKAPQS